MPARQTLELIGAASGWGSPDPLCAEGPEALRTRLAAHGRLMDDFGEDGTPGHGASNGRLRWRATLSAEPGSTPNSVAHLAAYNRRLAQAVQATAKQARFVVVGGDHSCAVGIWNGAQAALDGRGALGLIWIDAHMDAHTPRTTETGNVHGMPLAALLGEGDPALARLTGQATPVLKPEHVCLIGVRSFESGEAALLKRLGVRIYRMNEVRERGMAVVMDEALARVRQGTAGFGLSVDIDVVDPAAAPAVTTPVPNGVGVEDLLAALRKAARCDDLAGVEIAEFTPYLDRDERTAALAEALIDALTDVSTDVPDNAPTDPLTDAAAGPGGGRHAKNARGRS